MPADTAGPARTGAVHPSAALGRTMVGAPPPPTAAAAEVTAPQVTAPPSERRSGATGDRPAEPLAPTTGQRTMIQYPTSGTPPESADPRRGQLTVVQYAEEAARAERGGAPPSAYEPWQSPPRAREAPATAPRRDERPPWRELGQALSRNDPLEASSASSTRRRGDARWAQRVVLRAPIHQRGNTHAPERPARRWWWLLAAVVLFVIGAAVALFWYRLEPPLTAQAVVDPTGRMLLDVICLDCPDGTTIALGTDTARFKNGSATLGIGDQLPLGNTTVEVRVRRPGQNEEQLPLLVPVAYRVRADWSKLDRRPSYVDLVFETTPGSLVTVDGKPIALDDAGAARHAVDVTDALSGPAVHVQQLRRELHYAITPPSGSPRRARFVLERPIAPLDVIAPGSSIVIDTEHFELAGATEPAARVSVMSKPIPVAADGSFRQLMTVSKPGASTVVVRATLEEHAPRWYEARVRRVDSLEGELSRLRSQALTEFQRIVDDPAAAAGRLVLLEGRVAAIRQHPHRTLFELESSQTCGALRCRARVRYGARAALRPGMAVSVGGRVAPQGEGAAADEPASGREVPSRDDPTSVSDAVVVNADFVLPSR